MFTQSELYLIKMKAAGKPDAIIAAKLCLSTAEVAQVWNRVQQESEQVINSGYTTIEEEMTLLCASYQNIGERLKSIATCLTNRVSVEALHACVVEDREQTLRNLERFIILHPFKLPSVAPAASSTN